MGKAHCELPVTRIINTKTIVDEKFRYRRFKNVGTTTVGVGKAPVLIQSLRGIFFFTGIQVPQLSIFPECVVGLHHAASFVSILGAQQQGDGPL